MAAAKRSPPRRIGRPFLPALPLALFCVACAAPDGPDAAAGAAIHARYDCRDTGGIAVDYTPDTAYVTIGGKTHALPRAISASGARYTDGRTLIWDKGGTAVLETGGAPADSCRVRK